MYSVCFLMCVVCVVCTFPTFNPRRTLVLFVPLFVPVAPCVSRCLPFVPFVSKFVPFVPFVSRFVPFVPNVLIVQIILCCLCSFLCDQFAPFLMPFWHSGFFPAKLNWYAEARLPG